MEVNIHIVAVMHTDLPRRHDNNTILNSSDVSSPGDLTNDDERALDIFQRKASKRGIVSCWHRHINNASSKFSQRSRRRGARG